MALGNDYNDIDMLHWAGESWVVESSPAELRENFATIITDGKGGNLTAAVQRWLNKLV